MTLTFRLSRHHDLRRTTSPKHGIAYPRKQSTWRRVRAYLPRWDRSGLA